MSEKLREALEGVWRVTEGYPDWGVHSSKRREIREIVQQALSAAGDEPEMIRLLRWLEEQYDFFKTSTGIVGQTRAVQLWYAIEYIEQQFGYTLEEHDAGS